MDIGSIGSDNPIISGDASVVAGSGGASGSSGVSSSNKAASTDSVQSLEGEVVVDETPTADPGQPILRASTANMTAAELFAMTFSAMDRADQQRAQSALTTGNEFNSISTTTTTEKKTFVNATFDEDGNVKTKAYMQTTTVTNTDTSLVADSTLGEVPTDTETKKKFYYPPVFSDLQNVVQTPEGAVLLMPALSLVATSGRIDSFDNSDRRIDAATAVAYAEYTQGLVNSDAIKDMSAQTIPDDPEAAAQLAAGTEGSLLRNSVDQVGQSIGLNGLSNQVQAQTQLVYGAIQTLSDPLQSQTVIGGINLVDLEASTGMSQDELTAALQSALDEVSQEGPFYNMETMSAAYQASLSKNVSNPDTVNALITAIQNAGLTIASQMNFSTANINLASTENAVSQAIMSNWSESIEETAASSKAADVAHEILSDDLQSRYLSAQDLQNAIISDLRYSYPDMDEATARTISESIYTGNPSLAMSPEDFRLKFRNQYEAYLGIGPESTFGQALEHAVGISNPPEQTSYTALMNQSYEVADEKGRAFLEPGTSAGVATQQARLYEPGYQLVNQWSAFMDTSSLELSAQAQRTIG